MKILKWAGIGLIVLLVIGGISSVLTDEGRDGLEAGFREGVSSSTLSDTPEPTPTEEPTPTPTPTQEPAEEPTPTPEPVAEGLSDWLSYSVDRYAFLDDYNAALEGWDTSGDDPFVMAMDAIDVWEVLLTEQTDLMFVEPHACFADFHEQWVEWIDTAYEGYDVLTDAGIEGDLTKMYEAIDTITTSNDQMAALTDQLAATNTACGGG